MKIRWTVLAREQLRAVWSDALLARIRRRVRLLRRFPRSGRIVPEYNLVDRREVIVGVFRVGYVLAGGEVLIVTVIDGREKFQWPGVSEPAAVYGWARGEESTCGMSDSA